MRATLIADHCWRGQIYLKGDREIPEDLAIALNLKGEGLKAEGVETESESPTQPLTPNPQSLSPNPQTQKTSKRRRSNA